MHEDAEDDENPRGAAHDGHVVDLQEQIDAGYRLHRGVGDRAEAVGAHADFRHLVEARGEGGGEGPVLLLQAGQKHTGTNAGGEVAGKGGLARISVSRVGLDGKADNDIGWIEKVVVVIVNIIIITIIVDGIHKSAQVESLRLR